MIFARFPKAIKQAAERVYGEISTRICEEFNRWDWSLCQRQIMDFRSFLHSNLSDLGDRGFALELTQRDDSRGDLLTADLIATANRRGPILIQVGRSLRVLGYKSISTANADEEQELYSRLSRRRVIAYYEQRSQVFFYGNGVTCGRIDPRFLGARAAKASTFVHRPEHYRKAILDHYRKEVRNWNKTDHWANPGKRILRSRLGRAKKTEDIFLYALLNWLENTLGGTAHIRGKVGQVTSDETDIEISALDKLYMIEIKWLGKNERRKRWGLARMSQGLRQLRDYLQKQGRTAEATLLTYDGRPIEEFEKLTDTFEEPEAGCKMLMRCKNEAVPTYGSCMVLFLENRTASQK